MVTSRDSSPGIGGFRVRPARRGDAAGIVAILNESGATTDNHTFTWVVSHPEMEVFVAADHLDKPIGVVTLSHRPLLHAGGRAGILDELAVAKAWRRKGVGRELIKHAVERAKVLSVKRLEIESVEDPEAGFADFMKSCGFEAARSTVYRLT